MVKQSHNEVFQLTCADASRLGGPMGSNQSTPTLWTEVFSVRGDAVKYAIQFCQKKKYPVYIINEVKNLRKVNEVDASCYIFTIAKKKVR